MEKSFILASASPRRRDLLKSAGQDFWVEVADVNEDKVKESSPAKLVEKLSQIKAKAVFDKHRKPTLGADTVVVFDDTVIGKPATKQQAYDLLNRLSGKVHQVYTGVTLIIDDKVYSGSVKTDVYMNELSAEFIASYVESGKAMDKAGAYGVQDGGFVEKLDGSYTNVVGLPMEYVEILLKEHDLWRPKN